MDLLSVSSLASSFESEYKEEEEELDQLLDEYWFFENLFHRKEKNLLSTADLWNSIQNHKNIVGITDEEKNQLGVVDDSSSSKLSRQYSLSSSKAVPQVHGSEFQYYKRHSSDPLYDNSMHNNIQETVFDDDQQMVTKEKEARDSREIKDSSTKELSTFVVYNSLPRAPSLPPSIGRANNRRGSRLTRQASLGSSKSVPYHPQESEIQELAIKSQKQGTKNSAPITSSSKGSLICVPDLVRTPSLPPSGKEEEALRRSSKLSRQSSLTSSDVMPPINIPKVGLQPAPGIPRRRSESSTHKDGTRTPPLCATKEVIRRSLSYKRSSSTKIDLEVEEVQGFKDLGFVFDTEQINKSLAKIIPGLQEKNPVINTEEEENENKATRRPYLSEAWLLQPSKPTVPAWVDKRSAGDMKEQLKYWARSIASNVRKQEC